MKLLIALMFGLLLANAAPAEDAPHSVLWTRAIDRDDATTLRRLLPEVDVSLSNEKGKTALMAAAKLGDLPLLDTLLREGLTLQDRSHTGGTALMYAVLGNRIETIHYIVEQTKSTAGYIDAQSTNGWTAAMIASAKGFDAALSVLVDSGADPWLADGYQWTPLMRAIDNRHINVVDYLLRLPEAQVNLQNESGSTALHVAVVYDDERTVSLLLGRGADKNIRDKRNKRAADIAIAGGWDQLARRLGSAD